MMQRHTVIGERILAAAPTLRAISGIVRSTHERVDGTDIPTACGGMKSPCARVSSRWSTRSMR